MPSGQQQDGAIVSRGYSSPRNLERGLQMLPLVAASAAATQSSNDISIKFTAADDGFYSPMISPRTAAPHSLSKPQVPMLALKQLPAPKPASKPAQPLPVVTYKPKPKPVDVAFGYRVAPAASPRNSKSSTASKGSILEAQGGQAGSNTGVLGGYAGARRGSRPGSRRGSRDTDPGSSGLAQGANESMMMGPLQLPSTTRSSSSRIPKTPRSGQADAAGSASSSKGTSSGSSSSSKIPSRPANARSSTASKSSRRPAYSRYSDDAEETIFLDCAADDGQAEAGAGGSGGKGATFTLSCAISAVFNASSSNGADGGHDGITPRRLLQTAAAAFMSSVQQGAASVGYAQRQKQRAEAAAAASSRASSHNGNSRNGSRACSSNGAKVAKSSHAPAAAPAAASGRAASASGASSKALVPAQLPCRAAGTAAAKASASTAITQSGTVVPATSSAVVPATSSAVVPATSSLQIVQVSGASCEIVPARPSSGANRPRSCSSTALARQGSDTDAAAAKAAGATLYMQLQGSFPEASSSKARACRPYATSATSIEELFASLDPSEAGSSEGWRSASDNQSLALRTAPAVGPFSVVTGAGAATTAADGAAGRAGFHSAGTAASWAAGSSGSGASSTAGPPAAAAATKTALQGGRTSAAATVASAATAAAAEKGKVAAGDAREVFLTISPSALPFLAARSLSSTPVRLYITKDAVWGDTATVTAAPKAKTPRGRGKTPRLNPLKAVRSVIGRGEQQGCGEAEAGPGCAGGLFSRSRASRCE